MNSIVTKSLISSCFIGIIYVLALVNSANFRYYLLLMFAVTLAAAFYVLDSKLSLDSVKSTYRYFATPVLINMGGLYFISSFFQDLLKWVLITVFAVVNYYLWISLRKVYNLKERAALLYRNLLVSFAFLSVFLSTAGLYRIYVANSLSSGGFFIQAVLVFLTFLIVYHVSSFIAAENGADMDKFKNYSLVNALVCSQVAWLSSFWIVNYPVVGNLEKSFIGGTPLPSLLISIIFYFIWGLTSHKVDKNLDKKILNEYVVITVIFIFVLFITARWLPVS